ncbi:MAG: ATP-binding cassette domain-containing protein [Synergistaceae bacterium]|jgi:putative ABC transport system ATP-binding protein|nr:ATP-binding cassette domain-containing protein [Synergistaceae bacterium]
MGMEIGIKMENPAYSNLISPLLQVRGLRKEYMQPGGPVTALWLDFLEAGAGDAIVVTGPSGSGKTTLLHLLAALIQPSEGSIHFGGQDLDSVGDCSAHWRALSVGYVFQEMNLLPDFSLLENLMIAGEISKVPRALERSLFLLRRLGIEDLSHRRPGKLSLGEQQRAAVARAVLHAPPLLLADEPTASLDAENAGIVIDLLLELAGESKSLLLVATHDESVKKRFPRVLELTKNERRRQ